MKKFKYILLSGLLAMGMTSCEDYLDVNTDPDNPNSTSATADVRLSWIENYFDYAWSSAAMRTSQIYGVLTQTGTASANGYMAKWDPLQSSATTSYQNWFIGAAVNIDPMIETALASGANHYVGAGYIIKAMGFMLMEDLYGEIPVREAFTGKYNPAYDEGKYIYEACLNWLDEGLTYLNMDNKNIELSAGDTWNNGSVDKWKKLAYGLKARWLLKLSKKADFSADAVLTALQSALQSNDDNISVKCYNVDGDMTNFTVGDPYQASHVWNCVGYGTTQRLTRWYINLLTNSFTGGSGVIDPRIDALVPKAMTNVELDKAGNIVSFKWTRDIGIDMLTSDNIRLKGDVWNASYATEDKEYTYTISDASERAAFVAGAQSTNHAVTVDGDEVTVLYKPGQIYIASTDYNHAGDTVYVNICSSAFATKSRGGKSEYDEMYYIGQYIPGTGTFYAFANSDIDLMTYSEMCFIKAEAYMLKNDKSNAYTAYREGIKASFDRMQQQLTFWGGQKTSAVSYIDKNPSMQPMDEADIAAYLSSAAVCQSATDLTYADIFRQKIIAMTFSIELWNDFRRNNYNPEYFIDFTRPSEFTATTKMVGTTPSDPTYYFRRWQHSTHESNYNLVQLQASNRQAMENSIWSCPVWWDCATDDEYYGYIR